jgi:hypothetical protein
MGFHFFIVRKDEVNAFRENFFPLRVVINDKSDIAFFIGVIMPTSLCWYLSIACEGLSAG